MERLTEYEIIGGHAHAVPITSDMDIVMMRLAAYEDTGLMPEDITKAKDALEYAYGNADRIIELAAADKDGRLVVLPCKVGQRVFALLNTSKHISECEVKRIRVGDHFGFVVIESARGHEYGVSIKGFGKTVFLTREEAEKAALEGKQNESL